MMREDLDEELLSVVKRLFRKSEKIQISISSYTDFDLDIKKSREQYLTRLKRSIEELGKVGRCNFFTG
jgi:hypothetical protein